MWFADAIAARAVGQYPLSIATSLAIESAAGIHPDIIVDKPPVQEVKQLWINVRTLYRNLLGSLDKSTAMGADPGTFADAIAAEMDAITSIIAIESEGLTDVVFYFSNYAGMEAKYKHAQLRRDNTLKQKEYALILKKTMELLLKRHPDDIKGYDLKIKRSEKHSAMILTHFAYDLVSAKEFASLVLLESHTGHIKPRAQWASKYENGKELSMMPFREDLLQVFGDKQHFIPLDLKVRKELVEIAIKYHWNAVSTYDKLMYGISQMKNPFAREILRDIMNPRA